MPSLAGEERPPTWSGLSSHTPCGLAPSTFTDKAGSCSSPLSERMLPGSVSASAFRDHTEKGKALPIQYWGKDACWSALGQTQADLGHSLGKYVSCKDRVVSEVTFLHHHILPSPSLQWLVRFHFCLALRHLSLHSSIPALPSLTHYLTIKLTNIIEHFTPARLSPFCFIFSIPPCRHYKLPCAACLIVRYPCPFSLGTHPSVKKKKREKSLLPPIFFFPAPAEDCPILFLLSPTTFCDTDMVLCILERATLPKGLYQRCDLPIYPLFTYKYVCTCQVFSIATPSQNCHAVKVSSCKIVCEQMPPPMDFHPKVTPEHSPPPGTPQTKSSCLPTIALSPLNSISTWLIISKILNR